MNNFQPSQNSSGPMSYIKARPSQVTLLHNKLTVPSSHLPVKYMTQSPFFALLLLFNMSWAHTHTHIPSQAVTSTMSLSQHGSLEEWRFRKFSCSWMWAQLCESWPWASLSPSVKERQQHLTHHVVGWINIWKHCAECLDTAGAQYTGVPSLTLQTFIFIAWFFPTALKNSQDHPVFLALVMSRETFSSAVIC